MMTSAAILLVALLLVSLVVSLSSVDLWDALSSFESTLDDNVSSKLTGMLNAADFRAYEDLLMQQRAMSLLNPPQRRLERLGDSLCKLARKLDLTNEATNEVWAFMLAELIGHETNDADCREFHRYFELQFHPQVFNWHLIRTDTQTNQLLQRMKSDVDYNRLFQNPLLAGIRYMHHTLPYYINSEENTLLLDGVAVRSERVMQTFHLFVLLRVTGGARSPDSFRQVIEFGAGSGSNTALLREMGFTGLHVVYDFLPLLLMQQYFHRLSGWPSYMSDGLTRSDLQDRSTLLVSRWTDLPGLLSDPAAHEPTLFIATWSISEVPLEERHGYFDLVLSYGVEVILVVFQNDFTDIDNAQWFDEVYIDRYLIDYNYSFMWFTVEDGATNDIVAVKSELKPQARLQCASSFGCSEQTLVRCRHCGIVGVEVEA